MAETTKKKSTSKKTTKKNAIPLAAEVAPSLKSTPPKKRRTRKKTPAKTKQVTPHFVRDPIPDNNYSQVPGTGIFTVLLSLLIIAGVVLAGYVYSQKVRMDRAESTPIANAETTARRISVSSTVLLTSEVISALEIIVAKVTIPDDDVLQNVRPITDVATAQSELPVFFSSVQSGDLVFEFRTVRVLFRPSSKEIIQEEKKTVS